jgi:hypothetical protein
MKIQYNTEKLIIGIIPLLNGNGGNYVAVNMAYEYADIFKKQEKKIGLVNLRPNNDLAGNLIVKSNQDNELATHLKFGVDLINNITDKESFDRVRAIYDILIVVLDFEQLDLFNSFAKKKTSILILKRNRNNLKKITENIQKIKDSDIKYTIFNCPEKTNKISFDILKDNNIANLANIPYNELTVDNCDIEKSSKLEKIKNIKLFKKINCIKLTILKK